MPVVTKNVCSPSTLWDILLFIFEENWRDATVLRFVTISQTILSAVSKGLAELLDALIPVLLLGILGLIGYVLIQGFF